MIFELFLNLVYRRLPLYPPLPTFSTLPTPRLNACRGAEPSPCNRNNRTEWGIVRFLQKNHRSLVRFFAPVLLVIVYRAFDWVAHCLPGKDSQDAQLIMGNTISTKRCLSSRAATQMSKKSQPCCCITSRQWTFCRSPLGRGMSLIRHTS